MKRKIIFMIVMACAIMVGCSKKGDVNTSIAVTKQQTTEVESPSEITTTKELKEKPLTNVGCTLSGNNIVLPCTYKDIKNAGFDFKESGGSNYKLNPSHVSAGCEMVNSEGKKIVVIFSNTTKKTLKYSKCNVVSVSATTLLEENPELSISGVGFGSSYSDVVGVLGEANYSYEGKSSDESSSLKYYLDGSKDNGTVEFTFKDSRVCEILLLKE